jgi:hypothetical protein
MRAFLAILILCVYAAAPAHARDDGRYAQMDPELHAWFDHLASRRSTFDPSIFIGPQRRAGLSQNVLVCPPFLHVHGADRRRVSIRLQLKLRQLQQCAVTNPGLRELGFCFACGIHVSRTL